jgi:ABC-2 type transport system permease protein
MTRALRAALALSGREVRRFFRERTRVVGAFLQPLLFWAFFGAGLTGSFRPPGADSPGYAAYLFPGIVVLVLLFTAIFSTISVIEDRREGFLQGVLAAPVPRGAIVLGKVIGGTTLAVVQAAVVLLFGPLVGVQPGVLGYVLSIASLLGLGFGLTSLSFVVAWRLRSTQGFHAIMTVFLMPLWLLSGAFFPAAHVPAWLRLMMRLDPLTYGVALLRHLLGAAAGGADPALPSPTAALGWSVVFVAAAFGAAVAVVTRPDAPAAG